MHSHTVRRRIFIEDNENFDKSLSLYFNVDIINIIKKDVLNSVVIYSRSNASFSEYITSKLVELGISKNDELSTSLIEQLVAKDLQFKFFVDEMFKRFRTEHFRYEFKYEDVTGGHFDYIMNYLMRNARTDKFDDTPLKMIPTFDPEQFIKSAGKENVFSNYRVKLVDGEPVE